MRTDPLPVNGARERHHFMPARHSRREGRGYDNGSKPCLAKK